MKFQTYKEDKSLEEIDLSFYPSGSTKILASNTEISIDPMIPYRKWDYFIFISPISLDEYHCFFFVKKHTSGFIYFIDFSRVIKTTFYLDRLKNKMKDLNISFSKFQKIIHATESRAQRLLLANLNFNMDDILSISKSLDISPQILIQHSQDFQLIEFLRRQILTKKRDSNVL